MSNSKSIVEYRKEPFGSGGVPVGNQSLGQASFKVFREKMIDTSLFGIGAYFMVTGIDVRFFGIGYKRKERYFLSVHNLKKLVMDFDDICVGLSSYDPMVVTRSWYLYDFPKALRFSAYGNEQYGRDSMTPTVTFLDLTSSEGDAPQIGVSGPQLKASVFLGSKDIFVDFFNLMWEMSTMPFSDLASLHWVDTNVSRDYASSVSVPHPELLGLVRPEIQSVPELVSEEATISKGATTSVPSAEVAKRKGGNRSEFM